MHITLVVRPSAGGIRQHVQRLVEALPDCSFTLRANPGFWLNSMPNNLSYLPFKIESTTRPLIDLRAVDKLRAELGHTDIVHAHGIRAGLIGCLAARKANIPSILTVHNTIAHASMLQKFALKLVFKSSSVVVAISKAVEQSLVRLGAPKAKIRVICNGIPLQNYPFGTLRSQARAAYNITDETKVVVALGRLSPEKGFDLLSDVMATVRMSYPYTVLLLGGTGSEEYNLSQQLGKHSNNRMCGYIEDAAAFLSAADVVVIPSRTEGQSLVALEAMAVGAPVVASAVGGLVETLDSGRYGVLTEAESTESIADGIVKLLNDRNENSELLKSARFYVEDKYSIATMSYLVSMVYKEMKEIKYASSRRSS